MARLRIQAPPFVPPGAPGFPLTPPRMPPLPLNMPPMPWPRGGFVPSGSPAVSGPYWTWQSPPVAFQVPAGGGLPMATGSPRNQAPIPGTGVTGGLWPVPTWPALSG